MAAQVALVDHDYCIVGSSQETPDKHTSAPQMSDEYQTIAEKSAEAQKRYRIRRDLNETYAEMIQRRRKNSERQRKYEQLIAQSETLEQSQARKRKHAATQRKHTRAKRQRTTEQNKFIAWKGFDLFDETTVDPHSLGTMTESCSKCNALMFRAEQSGKPLGANAVPTFTLCCSDGAISIPPLKEPPDSLKMLLTGNTQKDRNFRTNIRAYNSSLAFASMCLTGQEYKFKSTGPYCFRINGQVYHAISQIEPESDKRPGFSQIYIYDDESQLDNRINNFNTLNRDVMKELQDIMKQFNPYAQTYRHVGDIIRGDSTVDVRLVLKATGKTPDPRRYNLPTGTDIAVIIPTETTNLATGRDVIIYRNAANHPTGKHLESIPAEHPMYDSLMYVLMFPFGDKGWEHGSYTSTNRKSNKCSALQYYRYRLMVRGGDTFNIIHRMGRLFQQYVVDMYVKIESNRLLFLRRNQEKIRAEVYQGLADAINSDGCLHGSQIGKRVILPSTFTGSARYQHQLYQDAMAIVRHFGKPDFFITFTCNPKWNEITSHLLENQTAADRVDLVARVFKQKLHALLNDIYHGPSSVLGKMVALIYVIEWQKRGPPHAHILVISDQCSKPTTDAYDSIVCAEIPDKDQFPEVYKIITSMMMHGPCGINNPNAPCMVDGKCTRNFPKSFAEETNPNHDGYPIYRRRNDGNNVVKHGVPLDNRYVVPYNLYLCKKYNAHINVEICNSVKSCKYLYKYVYKGPDMATVSTELENSKDEIKRFVNSRFVTASEAFWRICSFDVHGRDPSIQRLAVHEENSQVITFDEGNPEEAIADMKDTTLLGWFKLNLHDPAAREHKYHEIPEYYVWNTRFYKWTPRKRGRCIGRMYTTNPSQGERHYLRILLHHIAGATSFTDLKRSPDGNLHNTFKATALAMGLLQSDKEWDECMSEAAISFMAKQLRSLFVTILIYGQPAEPISLWQKHKESMGEDLMITASSQPNRESAQMLKTRVENEVLILLQEELEEMGTCLEDFGLPIPDKQNRIKKIPRVIQEEIFDADAQHEISVNKIQSLNTDQQQAFSTIMQAVKNGNHTPRMFFINAPGGNGKTFLFETLLSTVRGMGKIALAVASSGIAAELLEGGRTAHSRFKIPIPINDSSVCNISLQSKDAELIRKSSIIIWDEVMMSHVDQIDCVDRSLRDILKDDRPFGGTPMVFGGDPRQILPVVRHGYQAQIIKACIQSSYLWKQMKQINLTINMRLNEKDAEFLSYLLTIGNGTAEVHSEIGEDIIRIPEKHLVHTVDDLINKVYPHLEDGYMDRFFVSRRAILAPRNDDVDHLNEMIMEKFPGIGYTYLSADTVAEEDLASTYPTEYLNSITLSGMPPHSMTLKVGAPVILLRNLRAGPGYGLRNGTRLIIQKLGIKVLEVEIASGVSKGRRVLLPRIVIAPSDTELPFTLKRCQFPIRPCFAMSVNKAQGQTLDFVGIYLPDHVFTHGQLYVAFSRVRSSSAVAVYVANKDGYTKNIVYKEVL